MVSKSFLICAMALMSLGISASAKKEVEANLTMYASTSSNYIYKGQLSVTVNGSKTNQDNQQVSAQIDNGKAVLELGTISISGFNVSNVSISDVAVNPDGTIVPGTYNVKATGLPFVFLKAEFSGENYIKDGNCLLHLNIRNVPLKTIVVDYQGK